MQRADVLMVNFPFHDTEHSKPRPAVVIQADTDNQRLGTTARNWWSSARNAFCDTWDTCRLR